MTEESLVQKAYGKDNSFESARNIAESTLGITVKNKNDILRASTLSMLEANTENETEALKIGASIGAVTKSHAKKLGVADLF